MSDCRDHQQLPHVLLNTDNMCVLVVSFYHGDPRVNNPGNKCLETLNHFQPTLGFLKTSNDCLRNTKSIFKHYIALGFGFSQLLVIRL